MSTKKESLEHLAKPLESFSSQVVYNSTFCKQPIELQIRIKDDVVEDVGGTVDCSHSRQWIGALVKKAKGLDVDDAWSISGDDLRAMVPPPDVKGECGDCDTYVVAAFRLALRKWEKKL